PYVDYLQKISQGTVISNLSSLPDPYYIPSEHVDKIVGINKNGGQVQGLEAINESLQEGFLWIGVPYKFTYVFSEQVPQTASDSGKIVYQYGRLVLRSMKLSYTNSGKFRVVISP